MKTLKRLFLAVLLMPALLFGAANDIRVGQQNAGGTAWVDRIFTAESAISTTLASYRSSIGLGTEDSPTFGGITLTGTAVLTSAATAGLQLYNTADQTTNYERLEALWSGNVALIRQVSTGSVSNRSLRLQAQITSGATSTIELDRNSLPFGEFTYSSNQANAGTSWLFTQTGQSTATTGSPIFFAITPSYNQASGTAANTDLLINRTETAVGSGTQMLIQAQVGGANRFTVLNTGLVESLGGGFKTAATTPFYWNGRAQVFSPADGVVLLQNQAATDFSRLQFGGTTSSFPAISRSGTTLQLVLADASGFASFNTGVTNVSAGTATPAGGSTSARLLMGTTSGFGIYYGSGAPTVSAAQGSFYIRSNGSGTGDRAYINTDGGTTWTAITTGS